MNNDLKNKLIEILTKNRIDFDLEYHHKGHFININGADEINDDLESWIGYDFLTEYLVNEDILYNFSGSFKLHDDKLTICISFRGPYDDEFESVELPLDIIFADEIVKKDLEKLISTEIDFSKLSVQFSYDESEDFKYLDVGYWNETSNWTELTQNFSLESISRIKDFIKEYIKSNVPILNLPREIEQYYYVECEENTIRYYINSSELVIDWDAIEN